MSVIRWSKTKDKKLEIKFFFVITRFFYMNKTPPCKQIVKYFAWEKSFEQRILAVRELELQKLLYSGYVLTMITFSWTAAPFLVRTGIKVNRSPHSRSCGPVCLCPTLFFILYQIKYNLKDCQNSVFCIFEKINII